jgi:predicted GIY-YIG superfamily endonuclease
MEDHQNKNGAKFISTYGDFDLVYSEEFVSRAEAMKREKQLKGWTKAKKEALIIGDLQLLKIL